MRSHNPSGSSHVSDDQIREALQQALKEADVDTRAVPSRAVSDRLSIKRPAVKKRLDKLAMEDAGVRRFKGAQAYLYYPSKTIGNKQNQINELNKRENPIQRNHNTYKQEHWSVLDIDGVDKVFATWLSDPHEPVRLDLDGEAAGSVMRDLAKEGDNVNISAWLSLPDAVQLRDLLDDAIQESRGSR